MKKKQYISPLSEAQLMVSAIGIMRTSIEDDYLPPDLGVPAPKRKTDVF